MFQHEKGLSQWGLRLRARGHALLEAVNDDGDMIRVAVEPAQARP